MPRGQGSGRAAPFVQCNHQMLRLLDPCGAVAGRRCCWRGIAVTPSRDAARSHLRGRSRGDGRCGTRPLARYQLAPRRREITFGRQSASALRNGPAMKAIFARRGAPARASGRTQQRDVRVADCRSVRCGVRAAWDGLLVRHEREQAPTASSGTAACPGVATLLLNARSRRAGCLLASTSGAPGGCSGVALAMRPMLVARSGSGLPGGGAPRVAAVRHLTPQPGAEMIAPRNASGSSEKRSAVLWDCGGTVRVAGRRSPGSVGELLARVLDALPGARIRR